MHSYRVPCLCPQAPRLEGRESPLHEQGLLPPLLSSAEQAAEGAGGGSALALLAAGAAAQLAEAEAEAEPAADLGGEEPALLALEAPVELAQPAGGDALAAERAQLAAQRAAVEAEKAQVEAQKEELRKREAALQQGQAALASSMARAPRSAPAASRAPAAGRGSQAAAGRAAVPTTSSRAAPSRVHVMSLGSIPLGESERPDDALLAPPRELARRVHVGARGFVHLP